MPYQNKARISSPVENQPLVGWKKLHLAPLTSTAALSGATTYIHTLAAGLPTDGAAVFSCNADPTFDLDLTLIVGGGASTETVDLRIWGISEQTDTGELLMDYVGTFRATAGTGALATSSRLALPSTAGVWAGAWAVTDHELPATPGTIYDPTNHKAVLRLRHNFNGLLINSVNSAASRNVFVLGRFVNGNK